MAEPQSERELARLRAIARIHHSIGPSLGPNEIARVLVRELVDLLDSDACAILFVEGNELRTVCEKGFSLSFGTSTLPITLSPMRAILDTRSSILTGNVSDSAAAACLPHGCAMNSMICTPIMVGKQVIGIIHVDSERRDAYGQDDVDFVEFLAGEISATVERSLVHTQMSDLTIRDELTGCFNRRKFNLDLEGEWASAATEGTSLSLLMIDIDCFKAYHDKHGHQRGDVLLHQFGRLLRMSVRPTDMTYRYGGEQFVIILPGCPTTRAEHTVHRLIEAVRTTEFAGAEVCQPEGRVTTSIGFATYPTDASTGHQLLARADAALYQAREQGRNRACDSTKKGEQ